MYKRVIALLGLDRAISYSLISKVFSAVAQPAALYFIASSLSAVEQGYYYTFYSVLALTIFLELGLGVVITHFASNEFGTLQWTATRSLEGNDLALSRLLSILRKSMSWYGVLVFLSMAGLIPVGLYLFSSQAGQSDVNYVWPWILLIMASVIGTWLIPLQAILGGTGRIADLQWIRFIQNLAGSTVLCGSLAFGARLYAPALMLFTQDAVFILWFVVAFRGLIVQTAKFRPSSDTAVVSWRSEILPMQWRVALSWLSSYFISYTANPLLFAYRGPIEAGQMGMSRSIADLVAGVGLPWISTRSVTYGVYVSRGDYTSLDRIARRSTLQGMVVASCAAAAAIIGVVGARYFAPELVTRILPLPAIIMLMVATVGALAVNSMGEYLRAHKCEPYLYMNLVLAVVVMIANVVTARYFDATTMAVVYTVVTALIGWPFSAYVFVTRRREFMHRSVTDSEPTK
jgi:hypothetical protein